MDDPNGIMDTARDTLEIVWGFEDFRGVQEQVRNELARSLDFRESLGTRRCRRLL